MTEPREGAENLEAPPPKTQKVEFETIERDDGVECVVLPLSLFHRLFHIAALAAFSLRESGVPEEKWPGDVRQYLAEWAEESNIQEARAKKRKNET